LDEEGRTFLWIEHHVSEISLRTVVLAFELLCKLHDTEGDFTMEAPLEERIKLLQQACQEQHPDYLAGTLMRGAEKLGLPWTRSHFLQNGWLYGQGCGGLNCMETFSDNDSFMSQRLVADKLLTNRLLRRLGFPATDQHTVSSREQARELAARLGWPLVIKPTDRGQGKGVTTGISSIAALDLAFDTARSEVRNGCVILERQVPGDDHRLLVIQGKLVSVARRQATTVTGDGSRSIRELVGLVNAEREQLRRKGSHINFVLLDRQALLHLESQGLDLDRVLAPGQEASLRSVSNVSTGGVARECIAETHPDVRSLVETIAANLRLDCIGFDYVTTDIRASWRGNGGTLIEINADPGVNVHLVSGHEKEALGERILQGRASRIPTLLVIGGEERLRKMEEDWLPRLALEPATGYAAPSGPRLGQLPLTLQDGSVHGQVRSLVANKACERLVVALPPEQLLRDGLPLQHCDRSFIFADALVPEDWKSMLARQSGSVETFPSNGILPR
jgi:cyanophycin synthetase